MSASPRKPRTLRYAAAIVAARAARFALSITGRRGTQLPGVIATRLCPDFLERIPVPSHIVCVTGTNGKTTTSNLLSEALSALGTPHVNNGFGSNLREGIISAMLAHSRFWGAPTHDWAVFELDEISARRVLGPLRPEFLLVTNLFRDSYRRNAHVEYIWTILNAAIPDGVTLVSNADDLISYRLAATNAHVTFGVAPQPGEIERRDGYINDLPACPVCDSGLVWDFQRYHHIGRVHCPHCGLRSPDADFSVTSVAGGRLHIEHRGHLIDARAVGDNITDLYNEAAAISVLVSAGFSPQAVASAFDNATIPPTRFTEYDIADTHVVEIMGKDQNPIGTTRAFDYIGRRHDEGNTLVLVMNEENDHGRIAENVAWFAETNFEYLNNGRVARVGAASTRHWDFRLRFLIAGFRDDQITHTKTEVELAREVPLEGVDTLVIVTGTKNIAEIAEAREILRERLLTRR